MPTPNIPLAPDLLALLKSFQPASGGYRPGPMQFAQQQGGGVDPMAAMGLLAALKGGAGGPNGFTDLFRGGLSPGVGSYDMPAQSFAQGNMLGFNRPSLLGPGGLLGGGV